MAAKIKKLQEWCRKNTTGYKDVNVINMTTSWRDGLAFCALIHHYKPDIIDFNSLSKENALHNNQLAFRVAENELGIAALLDAEDILSNEVPDILGIVTYVSQYYNCFCDLQPVENKSVNRNGSTKDLSKHVGEKRKSGHSPETKNQAMPSLASTENKQKVRLCEICQKRIHFVERCIDGGKIYHRQCYRTRSLSGMYTRDTSLSTESKQDVETEKLNSVTEKEFHQESKTSTPDAEAVDTDRRQVSPDHSTEVNAENSSKDASETLRAKVLAEEGKDKGSEETQLATDECDVPEPAEVRQTEMTIEHGDNEIKDDNSKLTMAVANRETNDMKEPDQAENTCSPAESETNTSAAFSCDISTTDLKENTTEFIDEEKSEMHSESEVTDVFPSLLESLADVKKKHDSSSSESLSMDPEDSSSSSRIAPLISELPQTPVAKPRTLVDSQDVNTEKPKAKPRSSLPSLNSVSDHKQSVEEGKATEEDDYDSSLNPFNISDEEYCSDKESGSKYSYDDALNPFGNESSDDDENLDVEGSKPKKSLNPFDEDSDEEEDTTLLNDLKAQHNSSAVKTKFGNGFSANDSPLNPFSIDEEAENRGSKPPPPSRKKGHAPLPPKPNTGGKNLPQSTQGKSPKHRAPSVPLSQPHLQTNSANSSQPSSDRVEKDAASNTVKKRSAPNWKLSVEQKMEEMNKLNQYDKKYVENKQDTAPNVPVSLNKSPSRRPDSHKQTVKSSRPAPGFGFPLVKRDVKSQMTENEIKSEMETLNVKLQDLEKKGMQLENVLRDQIEKEGPDQSNEDGIAKTMDDWFSLVYRRNRLARREIDLIFLLQQQGLEQEHVDVEFKIRKLLNKPDAEKSEKDKEEESKLLEQLMNIVEKRSTLITSVEEARVREEEEDVDLEMKMLRIESANDSEATKKKKKIKMKKMFGKKKKTSKSPPKQEQPISPKKVS